MVINTSLVSMCADVVKKVIMPPLLIGGGIKR